jgi:CheY-like chemotaxis protein
VDVRTPRVAVIDDDEEFASLMEALLEEEGYAFVRLAIGAADPAEVVAAAESDVVMLDLRGVYDDGGLALLARLRAHPALAGLPVLVCSADIQMLRDNAGGQVLCRRFYGSRYSRLFREPWSVLSTLYRKLSFKEACRTTSAVVSRRLSAGPNLRFSAFRAILRVRRCSIFHRRC